MAAHTRSIGASRSSKADSVTFIATSHTKLPSLYASDARTSRPVFFTDSRIQSMSSGFRVRRSITSAEIPSAASCLAASSALRAMRE